MDKKEFQDQWKQQWEKQKKDGSKETLGRLFHRFTKNASPEWVKHWEDILYNTAGFAYTAGREIAESANSEDGLKRLLTQLSSMNQNINSSINPINPEDANVSAEKKASDKKGSED